MIAASRTMAMLALLAVAVSPARAAEQGSRAVPELAVKLSLSAGSIAPGQEVEGVVELANRGERPLSLLVPSLFVAPSLSVTSPGGGEVLAESGPRSTTVKTGLYLGRAVRLRPRERTVVRFHLYRDGHRRLLCTAAEAGTPLAPEEAAALDLPPDVPARYAVNAQVFRVPDPGPYQLVYRVVQGEGDRGWFRLSDGEVEAWRSDLWVGAAASNAVAISAP
jgi:hypothetical protein